MRTKGNFKLLLTIISLTAVTLVSGGFWQLNDSSRLEGTAATFSWPSHASWSILTSGGSVLADEEARNSCADTTTGGASPQSANDIASQAVCSGGIFNPGNNGQPGATGHNTYSYGFLYDDPNGDSDGCTNISDDFVYFRIRIAASPLQSNAANGFTNDLWWILLDHDNDSIIDFYISLNGNSAKTGEILTMQYEIGGDSDPTGEPIVVSYTNPIDNGYARSIATPDNGIVGNNDQYFIDFQLPVTDFDDNLGNQLLCEGSDLIFSNYTTSANTNDPFQKDFILPSGSFADALSFSEPEYEVTKTFTDVNGGSAVPGDVIEYVVTARSLSGNVSNFVFEDTLPVGATFVTDAYAAGSGIEVTLGSNTYNMTNAVDSPDTGGCDVATNCEADFTTDTINFANDWIYGAGASAPLYDEIIIKYQVTFATEGSFSNQGFATTYELPNSRYTDDPGTDDASDCVDANVDNCSDGITGNDDPTEVTVAETPDLSTSTKIDNDADDTVTPGQTVTYTLTLINSGGQDATGVDVDDTIDANMENLTVTSITDCGSSYTDNSTPAALNIDDLDVDVATNCVVEFTADVRAGTANATNIPNSATISAPTEGGPGATPSSDTLVVDNNVADISLTMTVDDDNPEEGDTVVFTITVTNDGPIDATNITVADILPAGLTYVSDDGAGDYDDGTGDWTIVGITNGNSTVLMITATVDGGTDGTTITNTAEVTALDQTDPDSTPNNNILSEDDQAEVDVDVNNGGGGGGGGTPILIPIKTSDPVTPSNDGGDQLNDAETIMPRATNCLEYVPDRDRTFTDLVNYHEFFGQFDFLKKLKIVDLFPEQYVLNGYDSDYLGGNVNTATVRPDSPINRLEVVKLALTSNCIPIYEPGELPLSGFEFSDLPRGSFPEDPVADMVTRVMYSALDYGIIDGFNHNQSADAFEEATLAQILKIFINSAEVIDEYEVELTNPLYLDTGENEWYYLFSQFAGQYGIVPWEEDSNNFLNPGGTVLRSEVMAIAIRVMYISNRVDSEIKNLIQELELLIQTGAALVSDVGETLEDSIVEGVEIIEEAVEEPITVDTEEDVVAVSDEEELGHVSEGGCSADFDFNLDLRLGSNDQEVRDMQTLLQCLGFFSEDTLPTGFYGPVTQDAVASFQSVFGLDTTGQIDAATREMLNAVANGYIELPELEVGEFIDTIDHWAEDEIAFMAKAGVVFGNPNGSFNPDGSLNRAGASALFQRVLEVILGEEIFIELDDAEFLDVPRTEWYADSVNKLFALELVFGNGDGTFAPERSINRAEFASMAMNVYTYFVEQGGEGHEKLLMREDILDFYSDLAKEEWYTETVLGATELGFVEGSDCEEEERCFFAGDNITRAEATVILYRIFSSSLNETVEELSAIVSNLNQMIVRSQT